MRPIDAVLQQATLDPASRVRVIVEARIESVADVRQRADQWALADGWPIANLEALSDGGVRLKATAGAAVGSTVQNAWWRSKEPGNTGGTYIDPLANTGDFFSGIIGQWTGTQANVAYSSVQAWLNPRFDTTKPKFVQTWECIIYQLTLTGGLDPATGLQSVQLIPVVRAWADAKATESAGWVVFTFQDPGGKVIPWHPDAYASGIGAFGPQYFIVCHGYDAKGAKATNIAWGYDNAHTSFTAGSGANLLNLLAKKVSVAVGITGGEALVTDSAGLPAFQLIPVTYAATATLTFKTGTPIDLGATPSAASLVEFAVRSEVPVGASVLAEVAQDPAGGFVTFKDGQNAAVLTLAAQRKYDQRVTLTASAAGDRTPIVRLLGARLVSAVDLGDTVEVISYTEQTDPITHKSEIEEVILRGIHDGERDYRDAISQLLSQNPPGVFYFRIYVGDRRLTRDQWLHIEDVYPEDLQLEDAYTDITCVSCLSFLKQALPVLTPDLVSVPVADSSNPGAWTASAGSVLFPQVADTADTPWAATTAYLASQRIIDANGNVQICTVGGTSGGSAPTWNTALGGFTIDSTVTWQNLGPVASGLPDDTTNIQSPVNPVNKDVVFALNNISVPQQSVGATIQFRAAVVTAGQSLTLIVQLRNGTTVRATKSVTVNVADIGQGSYTPFQYLLTVAEQAAVTWNTGDLNFLVRGNGTGQLRVGWLRLVVLGRRAPYVTSTIGASASPIMDDIIKNQIALDGRFQGPKYVDTSPAIPVSKTIEQQAGGSTDLLRAKAALDDLAWITGTFYCSEQGRVVNKPLYQVTTGTDLITGTTTAIYSPLTGPIRAIIDPAEIEPIAITPGWRQRLPLYAVPWGYNGQNFAGEAQVINAPALTYYRAAMIEADQRCPTETAQWISGEGLARGLSARHGQSFGLGLMIWRFRTTYARPELARGDVITFGTDRFLGYDPIASRAMAGKMWATGVIVGRYDALGREWAVWIQSLSAIRPVASALAFPLVRSQDPTSLGVSGYVGEAAGTSAGDNLNVFWAGTPAVASVKIAVSTASPPAAGTGTLFVGNQGTALLVGPYAFGTTIYVTITPYATVDGSSAAGVASYVVKLIDGSSISTPYNPQGSIPPSAIGAGFLTGTGGGALNGEMWIALSWPSKTVYRADGTSIVIPSSTAAAAAPTLAAVAGGALGARTYFVRVAYAVGGDNGMYELSAESSLAVGANQLLKVTSPAARSGFLRYYVLVSTTTNTEKVASDLVSPTGQLLGTDWTEPSTGVVGAGGPYNSAWLNAAMRFADMAASADHFFYPYYDIVSNRIRFAPNSVSNIGNSGTDEVASRNQGSDSRIPLSAGGVKFTTPTAGSGNSGIGGGTGGGGRPYT